MSWTTLSPGCRTQSDAVNAKSQSPCRVTIRSLDGTGVLGLGRVAIWHITPHADTVLWPASSSTYSTRSTGCADCRTTSRTRLYRSRMSALAALPPLSCDCPLNCRSSCLCAAVSNWSVVSAGAGVSDTPTESTVTALTRCDVIFTVRTAGCLNVYDDDAQRKHDAENIGWKRTANWLSATHKHNKQQCLTANNIC